ncbi:MAG: amidohydrolase family protein, partial [Acidobacteriota bacterium]
TVVTPTLVAYRSSFEPREDLPADPRRKYIARSSVEKAKEWLKPLPPEIIAGRKIVLEEFKKLVGMMNEAGVSLMAGTDLAGPRLYPGFSLHEEMVLLVEAGLRPLEALQAATRNPARHLGLIEKAGTIEKGKRADAVLLDANPLEDIRNISTVRAVILGGRPLDRDELDRLLAEAARLADKN